MRYLYGNLIFIISLVIFFTVYFTTFLDRQRPMSSVTESTAVRLFESQLETMALTTKQNQEPKPEPAPERKAKSRTDIFFLKTHKCASSSVQNILMRFGFKNGLDFVLPDKGNYLGNPRYFTKSMIGKSVRTLDGTYNIFTHHTRFNETSVRKVMKKDAVYVTILRKPAELFESVYNYYHFEKRYRMNLTTFIENYTAMDKLTRSNGSKFGINQMCFDLGLNEKHFESRRKIKKFILKIDKTFDLVMMTEYMEESLILLADLMKWPLENVVFLKLNARISTRKTKLNAHQRKVLRVLNKCDTRLQDFFFKKFRQQIENYGVQKMRAKLQEFIRINDEFYRKCVVKTRQHNTLTVRYQTQNTSDFTCSYAVTPELTFTSLLRNVQRQRASKMRSLKRLMRNKSLFKN